MTRDELLKLWPLSSESTIRRNLGADYVAAGLPHPEPESNPPRQDRVEPHPRKEISQGRCRVIIESRRARLCDIDNLYVKAALDAVRYAGFIRDDSPDDIELTVRQTKVKKKDEETVISIIPIDEISGVEAAARYYETLAAVNAEDRVK